MDNEPTLEINRYGDKFWRLNGELHRVDGPAIEFEDGDKGWYLHGKVHRVDGPAIKWGSGATEWWLNGHNYGFDEWLEANNFISDEEKVMLKLTYG
jgi:hypothetical protein